VGARFSAPVQTGPGAHPASCTMRTGSFLEVKYGRGVMLTTQPFPVPRSQKSRAIPLPTLWVTTGPVKGTLGLFTLSFSYSPRAKNVQAFRFSSAGYTTIFLYATLYAVG